MKILKKSFAGRMRLLEGVVCAFLFASLVVQSEAQMYGLTNKNSSININVASGPGSIFNWLVDGVNQLNLSWFYYRVGSSGPEYPIENINGTPTINSYLPTLSKLDLTYDNSSYSVRTVYQLAGQTVGSGKSTLGETITVANETTGNLEFHFFEYTDLDLDGLSGNQTVQFYTNSLGQYYKVVQTAPSGKTATETITTASVPIGYFEGALYNHTLQSLADGGPTTLSDSTNAGPGNVTFAYEWDVTLAPGDSFQISKSLAVVPEPSVLALTSSGMLALAFLCRRHRRV